MRKVLNLLSVLTISGTVMPNVIATSNYERNVNTGNLNRIRKNANELNNKKIPREIFIGNIELNNEINIIQGLIAINHSIFSRPEFTQNIVFERIFRDHAIISINPSIRLDENINNVNQFVIYFTSNRFAFSSVVPNRNLGEINNNYEYTILQNLQRLNPNIAHQNLWIEVTDVFESSALLRTTNRNSIDFLVSFQTNSHILDSIVEVTDLGEISDNDEETILRHLLELNPTLRRGDINRIENITNNSAIIYGNIQQIYVPTITNDDLWRPPFENEEDHTYYQNFNDSIEIFFTLNHVYQTLKPKLEPNKSFLHRNTAQNQETQIGKPTLSNNNNLKINWNITGPITDDKKVWEKTINLIKWSDYASSMQEFKEKYEHIKFNDVFASAGGQGTTISKENININFNTKAIDDTKIYKKENYTSIIKYDFLNYVPIPFINYVEQSAHLYIHVLFFEGEYLKATIISYTYSWMAICHVWTKLKIGEVEFY
ncbi:hypothetical protein S100390_v1c03760 [Spiroplasma sp. NBRC 100390]|uniref:hypothetical protein n=1 Tax=unclassified Spiroplasma TaxID=2637901 RepID=UPI0008928D75|nr:MULTISPECIES: hypothetical protein [unclassified Spiroplasma]AOX43719.1 hypothetical protein STU14_v1c03760 [Spiroplasma sp. TU-14]APE13189.1 hypothetical protein S100390_v1c03760 [Spiroplasma sp. NBRC 100390]